METGEHYGTEPGAPEVSVVFPCLNEEKTLAECVRRARAALDGAGLAGEIVVADNGSTDRSAAIAEECGARVVPVRGRGYGRAAMLLLIDRIRSEMDENRHRIFISFEPENEVAKSLYESLGFVPDGRVEYGEIVYRLEI